MVLIYDIKWSLKTLKNYFDKNEINFNEKIMSQIYDLSIKSILLTASDEIESYIQNTLKELGDVE